MSRRVLLSFLSAFALAVIFVPSISSAHEISFPYFAQGGILSCSGGAEGSTLPPCESICDLLHTGQHIIYFIMSMALFVVAPIMVFWGGILMLVSGGSTERIAAGHKMLWSVAIGIAIILGAFLIVNTFFYVAAQMASPGGLNINWSQIQCTPAK